MKTAILATLIAGAAAFAPAQSGARSTGLNAVWDEAGATAPLGFFDPMDLTRSSNDMEYFNHLREVEVRHGRCAMLAVTGWLTTAAGVRLPGMEDVPFGFKALSMEGMSTEVKGTIPLTLMTVFCLTIAMQDNSGTGDFPGDYRNGIIDFGWDKQSDEWKRRKQNIEINNGRAAQMGILGIMVHEQLGNLNDIGLPQP